MPRLARLDTPGILQHVMARGIERRKLFRDDQDRKSFLDRLAIILEETQTQCYAWALIPNHFHLLLRTGPTPLSKVMRRFMTGYEQYRIAYRILESVKEIEILLVKSRETFYQTLRRIVD